MVQISQQAIAETCPQIGHLVSQYMLIKTWCFFFFTDGWKVFVCISLTVFVLLLVRKCPEMTKWPFSLSCLYPFTPLFPIFRLRIPPGPDHGDDDRVLPLYLHHSGNVPCLLMQIESRSFSSPYRLSFWWIAANCQWGLDPVHNINFVWQAGGIMESSVRFSKHSAV